MLQGYAGDIAVLVQAPEHRRSLHVAEASNALMLSFCVQEKVTATQIDAHALRPEVRKKLTSVLLCTPQHHTTKSQLRIVAELGAACCRGECSLGYHPRFPFSLCR